MKCPLCHSENLEDSHYCVKCGFRIGQDQDIHEAETLTIAAPRDRFAPGSIFAGRYRIIEDLGSGGMGKVFKVLDTEINETVALKLILPEIAADRRTIDRFQNELKVTRKISHPNICRVHHLGKEKETYYIIMEYVHGESLKSMIQMTKRLSLETAVRLARQICRGLAEAHRQGVIHRDLKPQNIMVDREGTARIMDFGLARSPQTQTGTRAGAILGTPEYMSPEQAEGQEADRRSDIYSLGVILYEMVTGRVPFKSDSRLEILSRQISERPEPPKALNPELPDFLNQIILKCLEKKRESRYQSTEELLEDLEQAQTTTRARSIRLSGERATPSPARTGTLARGKRIAAGLAFVAVLAAGFFAWKSFRGKPQAVPGEKLTVAVISFTNQTGDPNYDYLQDAIPNLLITSLEQLNLVRVTTWERLHDLLKRLGREDTRVIDSDLGFELCRMDGIEAIVLGTFTKGGNVFVTDAKVLDVRSKQLLRTASSRGEGVDSILKRQIDELSEAISSGIGLEPVTMAAVTPIAEVATDSMEAYNLFLQGREALEKYYYSDARKFLEMAVGLDSEFAMAYLYLGQANLVQSDLAGARAAFEKAKEFGQKLAGKERLYNEALTARFLERDLEKYFGILEQIATEYPKEKRVRVYLGEYYYSKGMFDQAVVEFKSALALDPEFGFALNWLAYSYISKKDFDQALAAFQEYAAISPGDANPFDSMGELYFKMGKLDKAIEKFKEVARIKPDFSAQFRIAYCYAVKEDYAEAQRWIDHFILATPSQGMQAYAFEFKGLYSSIQGKVEQALREFNRAADIYRNIQNYSYLCSKFKQLEWICYDWGKNDLYRKYVQDFYDNRNQYKIRPEPLNRALRQCYLGLLDLKENRPDGARSKLAEVKAFLDGAAGSAEIREVQEVYFIFSAETLLAQGLADEAISEFQKTPRYDLNLSVPITIIYRTLPYVDDFVARALERKGDLDKAVAEYERLLDPEKTEFSLVHPFSRLRLAQLYEKKGELRAAIKQYEKVLEVWKEADEGLPQVEGARKRLAALRAGSKTP
jgi:tetratricopeptide (TPR) repeat protein/TolB-like protein